MRWSLLDLRVSADCQRNPVKMPLMSDMWRSPSRSRRQSGRTVFCQKFQKELPGLDAPPWPGELGQRIYENISVEAWKMWEERMKMILNEYRLMPWQKEAQQLVTKHMEDFFFGEGAALPPGYVPQQAKANASYPAVSQTPRHRLTPLAHRSRRRR